MKNMYNFNSCITCNDSITDPVCRNCYLKQTEVILGDLGVHSMAKEIILSQVKEKFPIETLNNTKCILCKKENVTLCRYCFSVLLIRILRELNLSESLIKNFYYTPELEEPFLSAI